MLHGWIPPSRYFAYLTWPEIRDMPDKENVVILQPLAAIEQHGPHLPVAVDSVICTAVLDAALEKLPADVPCYCLPPLCYGKSNEHIRFPGTVTLTAETLLRTLAEVADSVYRAGFRKLAIVNSHGGQPQVAEIVCRDLRVRHKMFAVTINTYGLGKPPGVFPDSELRFGIHAGSS